MRGTTGSSRAAHPRSGTAKTGVPHSSAADGGTLSPEPEFGDFAAHDGLTIPSHASQRSDSATRTSSASVTPLPSRR